MLKTSSNDVCAYPSSNIIYRIQNLFKPFVLSFFFLMGRLVMIKAGLWHVHGIMNTQPLTSGYYSK